MPAWEKHWSWARAQTQSRTGVQLTLRPLTQVRLVTEWGYLYFNLILNFTWSTTKCRVYSSQHSIIMLFLYCQYTSASISCIDMDIVSFCRPVLSQQTYVAPKYSHSSPRKHPPLHLPPIKTISYATRKTFPYHEFDLYCKGKRNNRNTATRTMQVQWYFEQFREQSMCIAYSKRRIYAQQELNMLDRVDFQVPEVCLRWVHGM